MNKTGQETISEIHHLIEVINQNLKIPLISVSFNIQSIKRILGVEQELDHDLLMKKIVTLEMKTQQMGQFLEQLVDLTKAQFSELPLKKNLTHTHDLVVEAVSYSRENGEGGQVELENLFQNEYCTVACDKDKLIQVFSSIIRGLSELTSKKSAIKISTKIKGEVAQFLFKNEEGIFDAKILNHIFDKFYPFNSDQKRKTNRASLGLALSKWIIEAHKGSIIIESKEKLGTIFTIELPKTEITQLKTNLT